MPSTMVVSTPEGITMVRRGEKLFHNSRRAILGARERDAMSVAIRTLAILNKRLDHSGDHRTVGERLALRNRARALGVGAVSARTESPPASWRHRISPRRGGWSRVRERSGPPAEKKLDHQVGPDQAVTVGPV